MQISNSVQEKKHSDPVKAMVSGLVDVMRVDFGVRFTSVFVEEQQVKKLKQRLYFQLQDCDLCDIKLGYETLVKSKPSFVPTVPEIADSVRQAKKLRLAKPYVALPKPKGVAKPDFTAMRKAVGGCYGKNTD